MREKKENGEMKGCYKETFGKKQKFLNFFVIYLFIFYFYQFFFVQTNKKIFLVL